MTGTLEAEVVAVRWSRIFGKHYVEAYENEELFWDVVAENGPPERAYKLSRPTSKLREWDFSAGLAEMRQDEVIDRRHRDARRIA